MITRGRFNHLLRPGLRTDFRDSYQQYPEEYSRYLKSGTLDRAEEERVAISALGRMARRGEIENITYLDPTQSPKVTYVDDEFALGFMVSKKMMEDDLYGRANQNAKWLGRAARLTQEYQGAALLDDAFTGAVFTGLLGETLIADDHELLNGSGTWSNLIEGSPQFGVTGMQLALELGEAQVDHEGHPMPMMLSRLVIDRTDEFDAIQITKNEFEPFTTDRNINAIKKKASTLNYVLSHFKSANGKWFLQDPNAIDMHFKFRVRPSFGDAQDEGGTLAAKFWARQRILVYFFDQRGIVGSNAS